MYQLQFVIGIEVRATIKRSVFLVKSFKRVIFIFILLKEQYQPDLSAENVTRNYNIIIFFGCKTDSSEILNIILASNIQKKFTGKISLSYGSQRRKKHFMQQPT